MSQHRVIPHEPICPQCGSFDITAEEVETGDGLTETAYLCHTCGEAWPVACVTDWSIPATPATGRCATCHRDGHHPGTYQGHHYIPSGRRS